MKIETITHPSGLKQEAIILYPDDKYANYVVFKNINNPKNCIIEIDRSSGFEREVNYDSLKSMTDKEIFNIFFN